MMNVLRLLRAACLFAGLLATARSAEIELTLQTREAATGRIVLTPERVDPKRVGVIAVDVWNFHWC
jgi:limonene-1,2-epoxide hydrolase